VNTTTWLCVPLRVRSRPEGMEHHDLSEVPCDTVDVVCGARHHVDQQLTLDAFGAATRGRLSVAHAWVCPKGDPDQRETIAESNCVLTTRDTGPPGLKDKTRALEIMHAAVKPLDAAGAACAPEAERHQATVGVTVCMNEAGEPPAPHEVALSYAVATDLPVGATVCALRVNGQSAPAVRRPATTSADGLVLSTYNERRVIRHCPELIVGRSVAAVIWAVAAINCQHANWMKLSSDVLKYAPASVAVSPSDADAKGITRSTTRGVTATRERLYASCQRIRPACLCYVIAANECRRSLKGCPAGTAVENGLHGTEEVLTCACLTDVHIGQSSRLAVCSGTHRDTRCGVSVDGCPSPACVGCTAYGVARLTSCGDRAAVGPVPLWWCTLADEVTTGGTISADPEVAKAYDAALVHEHWRAVKMDLNECQSSAHVDSVVSDDDTSGNAPFYCPTGPQQCDRGEAAWFRDEDGRDCLSGHVNALGQQANDERFTCVTRGSGMMLAEDRAPGRSYAEGTNGGMRDQDSCRQRETEAQQVTSAARSCCRCQNEGVYVAARTGNARPNDKVSAGREVDAAVDVAWLCALRRGVPPEGVERHCDHCEVLLHVTAMVACAGMHVSMSDPWPHYDGLMNESTPTDRRGVHPEGVWYHNELCEILYCLAKMMVGVRLMGSALCPKSNGSRALSTLEEGRDRLKVRLRAPSNAGCSNPEGVLCLLAIDERASERRGEVASERAIAWCVASGKVRQAASLLWSTSSRDLWAPCSWGVLRCCRLS
jgi:hypothetical protein